MVKSHFKGVIFFDDNDSEAYTTEELGPVFGLQRAQMGKVAEKHVKDGDWIVGRKRNFPKFKFYKLKK
jgi:hypothetical protein